MTKNTKTVLILILAVVLIAAVPLFALRGAEFGGSDDAALVHACAGNCDRRRTSGRSRESFFLHPDRNRSRYHRILHGTACGTEEMDEKGSRRT